MDTAADKDARRLSAAGDTLAWLGNILTWLVIVAGVVGVTVGLVLIADANDDGTVDRADRAVGVALATGSFIGAVSLVCVFRAIAVVSRYIAWRADGGGR